MDIKKQKEYNFIIITPAPTETIPYIIMFLMIILILKKLNKKYKLLVYNLL